MRENGNFIMTGRKSDMMIIGGLLVSPLYVSFGTIFPSSSTIFNSTPGAGYPTEYSSKSSDLVTDIEDIKPTSVTPYMTTTLFAMVPHLCMLKA
jgi:hypothetical protein